MKNIYLLLLFTLILSSCDGLLREKPKSFIVRQDFFKNASNAKKGITGVYYDFSNSYGINYWLFTVLHTDYAIGRGSQAPISLFNQILDIANIGRAGTIWANFYQVINRANLILDEVPGIKMDDNIKKRILAEAHFLRAISYFNLVRGFGPVPIKKVGGDISAVASPRVPVDKVYDLIIQDALAAEQGLPESVGGETGRASKWAAKMLLAEVYLTLEKWDKAAEKADNVINSGQFSLVLVDESDDFYNIFATVTNPEDILSIHNSTLIESSIPTFMHRPNTPPYNFSSSGYFAWLPNMNSFIGSSWNDDDLRKDFNLYRSYLNDAGDTVSLPQSSPVLFGKFITNPKGEGIYSTPIYRYTEAFLIYAEAATMANGSPTPLALERLNMIKRRAYGYDPAIASPVDYSSGMSKTAFRDAVLQERAYEFILEGKRWWDLKRTGRAKEAMQAIGKNLIDARLLWPIPYEEIDNNPAISQEDQNPGY